MSDNERNQRSKTELQNYSEVLADIARYAGWRHYTSGDSVADTRDFIAWAEEFQRLHADTDWNEVDYIETVDAFAAAKLGEWADDESAMLDALESALRLRSLEGLIWNAKDATEEDRQRYRDEADEVERKIRAVLARAGRG